MGNEKIPVQEHNNIIEMYIGGMTQEQIAQKYNVRNTTISCILSKYNIKRPKKPTKYDIYKDDLCKMYEDGYSMYEISDIYHLNRETLRKKLNLWGVSVRHSQYTSNEHYFDSIDHQDKAYIMGIWWADGYNNVSRNTILLSLQEGDRDILDKINQTIENTNPLNYCRKKYQYPTHQNCYRLAVTSRHMSQTLESYGMVQAKTLVAEFPSCITRDLYPHFIRGLLDGDGHISKKQYRVDITGTAMVLIPIQQWCLDTLGIEALLLDAHSTKDVVKTLRIRKKHDVQKFLDAIYKDANLYLQRKYDTYISKYCSEENINNASVDVANQRSNETEKTLSLSA
jgi:hypothetical protein